MNDTQQERPEIQRTNGENQPEPVAAGIPLEVIDAENALLQDRHLRFLRFDPRPEVRIPATITMCEMLMEHDLQVVREFAADWHNYWTRKHPEFAQQNRI